MDKSFLIGLFLALSPNLAPSVKAQTWAEIYTGAIQIINGEKRIIKQSIDIGSIKRFGGKTYYMRRACHYSATNDSVGKPLFCVGTRPDINAEVFDCKNKTYLSRDPNSQNFVKRMHNGEWWSSFEMQNGRRSLPGDMDKYFESMYSLVCSR